MDAAYLKAALPEPFTIFGIKLEPFCLGHELIFQRVGNRFSIESKELPKIEDLLIGIFICSSKYQRSFSLQDFKVPFRIRLATILFGKQILLRAFNRFSEYIAAHCELPEFYFKDSGDEKTSGAPTVQAVKVALMANLGLSEDDALNTPFSLAFWNHLTWGESQKAVEIAGEEHRKLMESLKETEKAVLEMQRRMNAKP